MRKGLLLCLSFAVSALIFFAVGCKNNNKTSDSVIRGEISDVILTIKDVEYDFHENVSFVDEKGKRVPFTCNDDVVQFGTPGKYVLTYQVGELQYERIVYIYGEPTITVLKGTIDYQDAILRDFSSCVSAVDTFGKEVPVVLSGELSYDENGGLIIGKQELTFIATDKCGNKTTQMITLNVLPAQQDTFSIAPIQIDYSRPYYTIEIGNREVVSIYCDGERLDETFYLSNNGLLMLTPEFANNFGAVAGKMLYINFNTCSISTLLTITDNQPTAYKVKGTVDGKEYCLLDAIELPILEKINASIQNVSFAYYVEYAGAKTLVEDGAIVPERGGEYQFIAEIYRNNELTDTLTQTFEVSHYSRNVLGLTPYLALGEEYDYSVQTDLTGLDIQYNIVDDGGILAVDGNYLTAKKEGKASVQVNINNGEIVKTVDFEVVDFGNTNGSTRDMAKTLSFWSVENGEITYEDKVNDLRTTVLQYSFNALKGTGDMVLNGELVAEAKRLGYQYLTFTVLLDNDSANLNVYSSSEDGRTEVACIKNGGRWQYQAVSLDDIISGEDIVFSGNGATVYLAKVEFVGADISEYAEKYLAESSTAGKSIDLINEDLFGKIVQTVCNTNISNTYTDTGMDKVSTTDNGDYFTYQREGYVSTYGRVENSLYISSEWIMAAKKQGYSVLGVWVGKHEGFSMLKRSADGTISNFKNNGAEWHAGATESWNFISVDISDFEEGDIVVISLSGESASVAGITFRTADYAIPNLRVD